MSGILEISKKIETNLLLDRNLEQKVFVEVSKLVSSAYQHAMNQTDLSYCFKFNLPFSAVTKRLYNLLDITNEEVFEAFKKDWGQNAMKNHMHKDPYYQILLLLMYYGIKHKKSQITENSFFVLLMKMWNGRRERYIKYCDPKIMNYVVSTLNKKYIAAKYDSPLFAIKDYFVPTLLKKYSSNILRNPGGKEALKRIFEQSWARFTQMFIQNTQVNLRTGKNEKTGGLMPLYMKAKKEGSTLETKPGSEEDQTNYMSVNEREDIANDITEYITSNTNKNIPDSYINFLYRSSNVNKKTIKMIIIGLQDYNLFDQINELILLMLSRLNIDQKEDICKADILTRLKKFIISSKNNIDVRKIRRLCNYIINEIFKKNQINIKIEKYTQPTQGKIRSLLIHLILVSMKKVVCHQQIIGKTTKFQIFKI